MNLEFYVLNYDHNRHCIKSYNIFGNYWVNKRAIELAKEYLAGELDYDSLKEQFRIALMSEEWARYEYEISAGAPFEEDCNKLQKIDCYAQALPNLNIIVDYIVREVQHDSVQ